MIWKDIKYHQKKKIKVWFHGALERFTKNANVEEMAKSNIRRSFSPNVSRQWSRKPNLRSLCVVLTTYVRSSHNVCANVVCSVVELWLLHIHKEHATKMRTTPRPCALYRPEVKWECCVCKTFAKRLWKRRFWFVCSSRIVREYFVTFAN